MFIRESSRFCEHVVRAIFIGERHDSGFQHPNSVNESIFRGCRRASDHVVSASGHLRSRYVGRPQRRIAVRTRYAKAYMTAEPFRGNLGGRQQYVATTTQLRLKPCEN